MVDGKVNKNIYFFIYFYFSVSYNHAKEDSMEKKCAICEKNFEGKAETTRCPSCRRKHGTNNYYGFGILVIIIGIVAGIIAGSSSDENVDSTLVMTYCIVGSVVFSIFIFSIHSICHRLDVIADKLDSKK